MKDKLEPNMYVRTKDGIISKIISIKNLDERAYLLNGFYLNKDVIKKASYNIIDILEVGDYVNGLPVRFVEESRVDIGQAEDYFWLKNQHIKSIVTHEQMEQMEYKVGD